MAAPRSWRGAEDGLRQTLSILPLPSEPSSPCPCLLLCSSLCPAGVCVGVPPLFPLCPSSMSVSVSLLLVLRSRSTLASGHCPLGSLMASRRGRESAVWFGRTCGIRRLASLSTGVSGGPGAHRPECWGSSHVTPTPQRHCLLCFLQEPLSRLSCSIPVCAAEGPGVRWGERRVREASVSVWLAGSPALARVSRGCPGPWVPPWHPGKSPTDRSLPACCCGLARARTHAHTHTRRACGRTLAASSLKPGALAGAAHGQGRLGGCGLPPGVLLLCANMDRLAPLSSTQACMGAEPQQPPPPRGSPASPGAPPTPQDRPGGCRPTAVVSERSAPSP